MHDLRCAIANCELRCAIASCDVWVRTHFVETCDVRACGAFLGLQCAIATSHIFLTIMQEMMIEITFLLGVNYDSVAQRILAIFDSSYPF